MHLQPSRMVAMVFVRSHEMLRFFLAVVMAISPTDASNHRGLEGRVQMPAHVILDIVLKQREAGAKRVDARQEQAAILAGSATGVAAAISCRFIHGDTNLHAFLDAAEVAFGG